jgi:hypothetical protein
LTTSDRWNAVSWKAQSFYIRLLTLVDDYGRYDARPAVLSAHAFPLTTGGVSTTELSQLAKELSDVGLAIFYTSSDKKPFVQLLNWHERPRSASKFPEFANNCAQLFTSANNCLLPTPSPSPSPSTSPTIAIARNLASDFIIPTESEYIDLARRIEPMLPVWRIQDDWLKCQEMGWKGIVDASARIRRVLTWWKNDGAPQEQGRNGKTASKTPTAEDHARGF